MCLCVFCVFGKCVFVSFKRHKDTKDTKYFSQSGALLGRGETGKLAYEAEHAKTTAFANRDKKPTN